jgi:FeS assembly SUF system protein
MNPSRVLPDAGDWPGPSGSESDGAGAVEAATGIVSDPVKTLEFKPNVIEALSSVYDPEIPVNIYELGLIYDIVVDAQVVVSIRMTLTAPACPAAQSLPVEVEQKIRAIPGVSDVKVDIVWDPPWDRNMMSDVAKLALDMY